MFSTWPDLIRSMPRRNTAGSAAMAKFSRIWNLKVDVSDLGAAAPAKAQGAGGLRPAAPTGIRKRKSNCWTGRISCARKLPGLRLCKFSKGCHVRGFSFFGHGEAVLPLVWPYGTFFSAPFQRLVVHRIGAWRWCRAAQALAKFDVAIAAFAGIAFAFAVFLFSWPARAPVARTAGAGGLDFCTRLYVWAPAGDGGAA